MNRPMPKHYTRFLKIAKKLKLSHPKGRALAACNRMQNGWPRWNFLNLMSDAQQLRRTRDTTAVRWEKHWNRGGSIKTLRYKTARAYNKVRRTQDAQVREYRRSISQDNLTMAATKIVNRFYEEDPLP